MQEQVLIEQRLTGAAGPQASPQDVINYYDEARNRKGWSWEKSVLGRHMQPPQVPNTVLHLQSQRRAGSLHRSIGIRSPPGYVSDKTSRQVHG